MTRTAYVPTNAPPVVRATAEQATAIAPTWSVVARSSARSDRLVEVLDADSGTIVAFDIDGNDRVTALVIQYADPPRTVRYARGK